MWQKRIREKELIMITRNFIEKIHLYFDELNYHPTENFDLHDFYDALAKTVTHCETLNDVKTVSMFSRYIFKKIPKIRKMFAKKKEIYNRYKYEGSEFITRVSDEDACGQYYLINGLTNNADRVFLAGNFEDCDKLYEMNYAKHSYFFHKNGYSIRYDSLSSKKMNLYDKDSQCLGTVVLKDDKIEIRKNSSPFEVLNVGEEIYIFRKKDFDSGNKKIDLNKAVAIIEWELFEGKDLYGVSRLSLLDNLENEEFELICLLAVAPYLIYRYDSYTKIIFDSIMIGSISRALMHKK